MTYDKKNGPEEFTPPAFWSPVTGEDLHILASQMRNRKFDPSSVLYVAARCGMGVPQVVVSSPLSKDGAPFPTIFWLTCPWLVQRCGELESLRKISELEAEFRRASGAVELWHRRYAALRLSLLTEGQRSHLTGLGDGMRRTLEESGVGGIDFAAAPFAAKCLHLQTATMLGMREHPAKDWLASELGALECPAGYGVSACASAVK